MHVGIPLFGYWLSASRVHWVRIHQEVKEGAAVELGEGRNGEEVPLGGSWRKVDG